MPTIILTRLTCNQTEDNTGADEASLRIWADANFQSLSRSMDNGDTWDLNIILNFENRVKIQLYDLDNPGFPLFDDHDHLGTVTITPAQAANPGNGTFTQDGANYEIEWIPASRELLRTLRETVNQRSAPIKQKVDDLASLKIDKNGNYVITEKVMEEMMKSLDDQDDDGDPNVDQRGIFGSKHTYCCKMGHDSAPDQERQQFRSYSWQAPLFCIRMARGKGWSVGSVSRGECEPRNDD